MSTVAVVVGHGSIGARHARVLREQGCRVAVVSGRPEAPAPAYRELRTALQAEAPDYVVVASPTARHGETVESLAAAGFAGTVLVEKPLFARPLALPENRFRAGRVGYNLRFHPVLRALKRSLDGERAISAQVYVGQYLPDWRPDRDYRACYAASVADGGGVLRDLSHELDYLTWLFGAWQRLAAIGGRLGSLEIDSDDCWGVLLALERCPVVTLQLNYLDRRGRREILINTPTNCFRADLVANTLERDRELLVDGLPLDRDATYRDQHRAILSGTDGDACDLRQGADVVAMVDAIERAQRDGTWVTQ